METQVPTMQAENSGISPKLRTYGQLRGWTLQRHTIANGGATLDLSSPTMDIATHTTGYYVSGKGTVHSFPVRSDVRPYQRAIGDAYAASQGTGLVGTWVHAGRVYAELAEHYTCRMTALIAARKSGQMEIFDIAAKKSIPVELSPKWGYPNAD